MNAMLSVPPEMSTPPLALLIEPRSSYHVAVATEPPLSAALAAGTTEVDPLDLFAGRQRQGVPAIVRDRPRCCLRR